MNINDWSPNPANNTLIGDINWSEGQMPSTVNNSARQMMADVAVWRDYLMGSTSPFAMLSGATFTGPIRRDAGFYLDYDASGNPILNFDHNDYLVFDRSNNALIANIRGQNRMILRDSGNVDFYSDAGMYFNGLPMWHQGNLSNLSQLANGPGYITQDGRAYPRRSDGQGLNFKWEDTGVQPQYFWGGDDGINMRVYPTRSLHVRYSDSATNADTVDGYRGHDLAKYADWTSGSNANGYWSRSPDGIIEQWGSITGVFPEGATIHNFPIPFTDLSSVSIVVVAANPAAMTNNDIWCQIGFVSLTQFAAVFQAPSSGNQGYGYRYIARGR